MPSPSLTTQCQEIVAKLDQALQTSPRQIKQEVDEVESLLAQLRDRLIDQLRYERSSPMASYRRIMLDRCNTALSLVIGVEYPAAGIQRSALQQARDLLAQEFH